jgi:ABC-type oligopeptide transport system substrate-binding subunit
MKLSARAPGSTLGAPACLAKVKRPGPAKAGTTNGQRVILRFLLPSAFCLLLCAGCTRSEPRADLVILNGAEPESLDPAVLTGQADGRVALSIFEGLTRFNPTNAAPLPGLAERWDIAPDGRVYTFHLRSNAVWSTGEPIAAGDFVYSWLRVLDPLTASEYAGQLFYLKNGEEFNTGRIRDRSLVGLKALDDRAFRVELKDPTPFFLDLCALPTLAVVPRHWIQQHGDRWLMKSPGTKIWCPPSCLTGCSSDRIFTASPIWARTSSGSM